MAFPDVLSSYPRNSGNIYLTFDDGPDPIVTPLILDTLKKNNVKATFFCIGEKVMEHPEIFLRILNEGHTAGSHGHKHLNAWRTKNEVYLQNVYMTKGLIKGNLFRPPYGKLRKINYDILKKEYRIVLWSLLSFDYLNNATAEKCMEHLRSNTNPGDIVVFHDNSKIKFRLDTLVHEYICFCREKELKFSVIS